MDVIVGIDLSSVQINACVLDGDDPPLLLVERLGRPMEPLIERLRRVPEAIARITAGSPTWLVLEDCFGRNRNADRALNRTVGSIVASCPSETQIAIVSSGDWRKALGCVNRKQAWHDIAPWFFEQWYGLCQPQPDFDEHELDAIGVALAWKKILASQATPGKASTTRGASAGGDT